MAPRQGEIKLLQVEFVGSNTRMGAKWLLDGKRSDPLETWLAKGWKVLGQSQSAAKGYFSGTEKTTISYTLQYDPTPVAQRDAPPITDEYGLVKPPLGSSIGDHIKYGAARATKQQEEKKRKQEEEKRRKEEEYLQKHPPHLVKRK